MKKLFGSLCLAWFALWLPAAQAQPFNVGLRLTSVDYLDTRIDVALWYPTKSDERPLALGPYQFQVARDAEPAVKARPLVVISHGTGGNMFGHFDLAEALARRGYVVAALTHPGDNYRDRSLVADARYFSERPHQVSVVLDALLARPDLAPLIDAQRIGAIGHSAGGHTVAALLGGRPDVQRVREHCAVHAADDPMCSFANPNYGVAYPQATSFKLPAGGPVADTAADPRIRAAVLMAPVGAAIAPGSMASVQVPVLLLAAAHDEVLAPRWHAQYLANEIAGVRTVVEPDAGHYSFIAPVAPELLYMLGPAGKDPAGFDRGEFHRRLAPVIVAFFDQAWPR